MAFSIEVAEVIEQPVDKVFAFYADDHVKNHPRWDPNIELWLEDEEPIQVGTVIHRRNSRSGKPVEGTMEVTEFERDQAMAVVTHDGPMRVTGRATFDAVGPDTTKLTIRVEFPLEDSMKSMLSSSMKQSLTNIKSMLETPT
jgi:uncharacterized protein YndB with AHSA1/START domain